MRSGVNWFPTRVPLTNSLAEYSRGMASGNVNRINRPNTRLHRPGTQREVLNCRPGAVHTWHLADELCRRPEWAPDPKADSAPCSPDEFITLSDKLVYAEFFFVSGLLLFFPSLMGGTWAWRALSGLFLLIAVWSAFQWWTLRRRSVGG
jgi:hypothetical protein